MAANVDAARLTDADRDARNWMSYGRTYSEQRFSPLARIDASNAAQLGLVWFADFDTNRGQESTPLVIDGVLYVSTAWSMVRAFDAKTGRPLWSYDPKVPRALGVRGCCDVVNRGVAAWQGKLYLGTFDGRLIALDAATGKPVWSVMTVDPTKPYTITMAPRIVKGRVLIGNSGNEFGVRGYLSAYDAGTGALAWRFYTVPGNPALGFETPAMEMAAKTWFGEWWKLGGGGTVWDAISYDPQLNLVYFGVGNGAEWNREYRSAGKGDNLFLSSIVAVNADTGAYVWHYQATPGDEWDYDADQQLVLADLNIAGQARQVLIQANKNGFLYVLDRKTGQLISANPFTPVTWASGVDLASGRPIELPDSRYDKTGKSVQLMPGALGAHNWQPMAFNPSTGLVYIPAQEIGMGYADIKDFKPAAIGWNLGVATTNTEGVKGYLVAWDPVAAKERWRVVQAGPWNGGVLTTGGNLVVEGNATGAVAAYRADTGAPLWSAATETPVMAAPMGWRLLLARRTPVKPIWQDSQCQPAARLWSARSDGIAALGARTAGARTAAARYRFGSDSRDRGTRVRPILQRLSRPKRRRWRRDTGLTQVPIFAGRSLVRDHLAGQPELQRHGQLLRRPRSGAVDGDPRLCHPPCD